MSTFSSMGYRQTYPRTRYQVVNYISVKHMQANCVWIFDGYGLYYSLNLCLNGEQQRLLNFAGYLYRYSTYNNNARQSQYQLPDNKKTREFPVLHQSNDNSGATQNTQTRTNLEKSVFLNWFYREWNPNQRSLKSYVTNSTCIQVCLVLLQC